jgi:hypothetical protein
MHKTIDLFAHDFDREGAGVNDERFGLGAGSGWMWGICHAFDRLE